MTGALRAGTMPTHTAPFVSVIIPVLHDVIPLRDLLEVFPQHPSAELIVVDGGQSGSEMSALAERFPSCRWVRSQPGRGRQMNVGARMARGTWLLFLHADTRLPGNWVDEVRRADGVSETDSGCFRFALDSKDWRARVVERGVALRVRWFGLPYGDQALFVRRDVFERLGGYAEMPLMEDVELVRRLRREGRAWRSTAAAVTSDRRWRQDGWLRRSAGNMWILLQYLAGVSPGRLAAKYGRGGAPPRSGDAVVAVMSRAPSDRSGKTRLVAGLAAERATALRRALLLDTLAGVGDAGGDIDVAVLYTPPESQQEFQALGSNLILLPQSGSDLGERMYRGLLDLFARGYDLAIIVGSDLPRLRGSLIEEAASTLRQNLADVILGPADDGGYYLLGLRKPYEGLFQGIQWSTSTVLATTIAVAHRLGLRVHLLPQLRDVDTREDLRALMSEASGERKPSNVRAWLSQAG